MANDMFAPPSEEERNELIFAPPTKQEVNAVMEPDRGVVSDAVMNRRKAPEQTAVKGELAVSGAQQSTSILDELEAGWDMSVTGLISGRPDMVLPPDPSRMARIASMIGQVAGDLPAMVAGFASGAAIGGAAGTVALPVVGTVGLGAVGGFAGADALPEAMRAGLIEAYEKGGVNSFEDFWDITSASIIAGGKGALIGGVTAGVGGKVLKGATKLGASAAVKTTAQISAEVATMTTVGQALEGQIPSADDFVDGAILLGGLKGAGAISSKFRTAYAKEGKHPVEVLEMAENDPKVKQGLISKNNQNPLAEPVQMSLEDIPESVELTPPLRKPKLENADLDLETQSILEGVGEKTSKGFEIPDLDKIYTDLVDKLHPLYRAVKLIKKHREIPANLDPHILARMVPDSKAKAKHFFEKGTIDAVTLEVNGPSLKQSLEAVPDTRVLSAFMISKRVLEKSEQGLKTGFDVDKAKQVVAKHEAIYGDAAKQVTEFQNRTLDYLVKSEMLSAESAKRMREMNNDYVPFKRISEAIDGSSKAGGGKKGSLKAFKGSELDIQDPITSIVENTINLIEIAEANKPKVALVNLANSIEGQTLLKEVKDMSSVRIDKTVVKSELKKMGLDPEKAQDIVAFTKGNKDLADNQFAVYIDGKRKIFETEPALAESLNRLGGDSVATNLAFKIANNITIVKKLGITFTPDFVLRNLIRDNVTAGVFSKGGGINPLDVVAGMRDLISKNDTYFNWLKAGGANGAFLDMGERYISKDILNLQKETGFMHAARNVVMKPVDFLRVAAELGEQSLRIAEFKKVTKGQTSPEALAAGGFASREVTLDFQRIGAKMSALNSISAFLNVSIQGPDKTVRAFLENPKLTAARAATFITVPSLLLYWANHGDQRVSEVPDHERDLNWIVATDDWQDVENGDTEGLPPHMVRKVKGKLQINKGTLYKIPKPMELGVMFGSLPERALDAYFKDNPDAFKNFGDTISNLIVPGFMPDAVTPVFEQMANRNFFQERDIVPHHLKDVMPEYQYMDFTSETAKALSKVIPSFGTNVKLDSPLVIDNYLKSWTGTLGTYAVKLADEGLKAAGIAEDTVDPASKLSDIPFIKSFIVRYPKSSAKSITEFRDIFEKTDGFAQTINILKKSGQFDEIENQFKDPDKQALMVNLQGVNKALSNQNALIRKISKNPEMTPDDKRQNIDAAYYHMIETAKLGVNMYREIQKSLKENKGDK